MGSLISPLQTYNIIRAEGGRNKIPPAAASFHESMWYTSTDASSKPLSLSRRAVGPLLSDRTVRCDAQFIEVTDEWFKAELDKHATESTEPLSLSRRAVGPMLSDSTARYDAGAGDTQITLTVENLANSNHV